MCVKCNAPQKQSNSSYSKPLDQPCKYTIDILENLLNTATLVIDKSWIQSAINTNNSKSCNKYNNKIDEIIRKNL